MQLVQLHYNLYELVWQYITSLMWINVYLKPSDIMFLTMVTMVRTVKHANIGCHDHECCVKVNSIFSCKPGKLLQLDCVYIIMLLTHKDQAVVKLIILLSLHLLGHARWSTLNCDISKWCWRSKELPILYKQLHQLHHSLGVKLRIKKS